MMNANSSLKPGSSKITKLIILAALSALPMSVAMLRAAEPAKKDEAKKADVKPEGKPGDKKDAKKEDKDAWKIAENWKLDILASHPAIHHPSVICPAPDGRIFLAEDPMDMKGSSKDPTDRILVIHPDGKITVFAEGLYAVFGLQYIDGKLYVHHTPKFSVFTDDNSVGKNRFDIIDTTNPSPNVNGSGFNDHVPSNIRLAMDGYIYISTGDKGIYGAASNIDHKQAEIHGGGIMRIRPDGTDIEAYSTGTRNHLDMAINAEDEMFTYDNTDDGNGWWTRVTHMVDGGFYGYPYDYRPPENDKDSLPGWSEQKQTAEKAKQAWEKENKDKPEAEKSPKPPEAFNNPFRPWTLWRMEEYGGGSPTGSTAYNEEALPVEFHGNIFMSEWGKSQVERFVIERKGATYKVNKREVILKGGPGQLRPVGIQVLPDGSGILVADWNFSGWRNANTDAGRLLKLTYKGELKKVARPTWYVPAASGKEFTATTAELMTGLAHPAQTVRLVAQRRLAERAKESTKLLTDLLAAPISEAVPAHAKWHAIWTLDRIDGGVAGRDAILNLVKDNKGDATVRMQAMRQLGTRKAKEAIPALIAALNESDEAIRLRAAVALGRVGDAAAVSALLERLDDKDLFAHYSIFTALNRIATNNPFAWEAIVQALKNERTETRAGAALAMHETYDPMLVQQLAMMVKNTAEPADARAAAVAAIAPLQKQRKKWAPTQTDLQWWGTQPGRNAAPPKNVEWAGTQTVTDAMRAALNDSNDVVRHAAVQGLKYAPDPAATATLVKLFETEKDAQTRKAILAALSGAKAPETAKFVDAILSQAKTGDPLFVPALDAAEVNGGSEMAAVLVKFVSGDHEPGLLTLALQSLSKLPDVKSINILLNLMQHTDGSIVNAAADAMGAINDDKSVVAVVPLLKHARPEVKRAAANALGNIKRGTCLEPLLAVWKDKDIQKEAITALAARADVKALDAYLEGLNHSDGNTRNKSRKAIESIHEKALPLIEARLDTNPLPTKTIADLKTLFEKFIPQEKRTGKLFSFDTKSLAPEAFVAFAKDHVGDVARGKKLFMDQNTPGCIKCHKIGNQGGEVGPALDGVGTKYQRDILIESILFPSKQILDGYQQTNIKRKSNNNIEAGIVRAETETSVTLIDSGAQKIVIEKSDIASRKVSNVSIMPDGLQTALKPEEFVDLVAYLESLKEGKK